MPTLDGEGAVAPPMTGHCTALTFAGYRLAFAVHDNVQVSSPLGNGILILRQHLDSWCMPDHPRSRHCI